jgi:hypothetical protein
LPYQLDLAWEFIHALSWFGIVSWYRDPLADFLRDHYEPYVRAIGLPANAGNPIPSPAAPPSPPPVESPGA